MATFLPKKRKSLYHRITIPQNLRQYFDGREEVWRSLHTNSKEEAVVRSSKWESEGRALFLKLKRYGKRMDKAQIKSLVERREAAAPWLARTRQLPGPAQRVGNAIARRVLCGVVRHKQDTTCPQLSGAVHLLLQDASFTALSLPIDFNGLGVSGESQKRTFTRTTITPIMNRSPSGLQITRSMNVRVLCAGVGMYSLSIFPFLHLSFHPAYNALDSLSSLL
jgi:hypothetical protein